LASHVDNGDSRVPSPAERTMTAIAIIVQALARKLVMTSAA
jgi:hypothetical protein